MIRKLRQRSRLRLHALTNVDALLEPPRQHLQREQLVQHRVLGDVDLADATASEQPLDHQICDAVASQEERRVVVVTHGSLRVERRVLLLLPRGVRRRQLVRNGLGVCSSHSIERGGEDGGTIGRSAIGSVRLGPRFCVPLRAPSADGIGGASGTMRSVWRGPRLLD